MKSDGNAIPLVWTRSLAETYWRGVFVADTIPARRQADLAGVALAAVLPHVPGNGALLDLGARRTELLELAVAAGLNAARLDVVTRCVPIPGSLAESALFLGEFAEIPEKSFDAVVALDLPAQLLEKEFPDFLDVVRLSLQPGGLFCFIVPNNEKLEQHFAIDPLNGRMFHPHQRVRSFDPASVEAWLEENGFRLVGLHQVQIDRLGIVGGTQPLETITNSERSFLGDGSSLLVLAAPKDFSFRVGARAKARALVREMRKGCRAAEEPPAPFDFSWDQRRIDAFWSYVANTPLDELSFGRHNGPVLFRSVERWLRPGGRHIDIGAGEGHFISLLLEHGYKVAAYEPAPGRRELLDAKFSGVPHYLGSLSEVHVETLFDVALAFEVIEHIPSNGLETFLRGIWKLLGVEGVLILTTPCRENLKDARVYSPLTGAVFHRWQHVQCWTPERLREVLAVSGFQVEVIHEVDFYGMGQGRYPFYEILLNSRVPRLLGNGSNILCIARKRT